MRRTFRDLADARKELLAIQQEFGRLEKRIDAVRDCVTGSLVGLFGEERPAFAGLQEEELIERIAGRVVAQLNTPRKFRDAVRAGTSAMLKPPSSSVPASLRSEAGGAEGNLPAHRSPEWAGW